MNEATNLCKEKSENKVKTIKEKKLRSDVMYVLDRGDIVFIIVTSVVLIGAFLSLWFLPKDEFKNVLLDCIIAFMSLVLLAYSVFFSKASERTRYISGGSVLLVLLISGFVTGIAFAIKPNSSLIARIVSMACMFTSWVIETVNHLKHEANYAEKRKQEREDEIENTSEKSCLDGEFSEK